MREKFYICKHCGNIVAMVKNAGVPVVCCGEKMTELVPNTVDAANEKHIPVVEINGNKVIVKIGSVEHPMLDEHYIEWIRIETENGGQRATLKPGDKPEATFIINEGDKVLSAAAYCNLHGLWATEL